MQIELNTLRKKGDPMTGYRLVLLGALFLAGCGTEIPVGYLALKEATKDTSTPTVVVSPSPSPYPSPVPSPTSPPTAFYTKCLKYSSCKKVSVAVLTGTTEQSCVVFNSKGKVSKTFYSTDTKLDTAIKKCP